MTPNLPADFFARTWQREPRVLRDFLPGWQLPCTPDDLAGLATMDAVESRIVLERGGAQPWELRHGPFAEDSFAALPDSHWTLLVQAVDHWEPDIAALRRLFPQLPHWRLDDVMVSYAADQGSVGPHTDQYDVVLLQGAGRRRWRLGGPVPADAPTLAGTDLRLLASFDTQQEVVLEEGDALYLPPGHAHWGIAEGECVTVSIGFRAPGVAELMDAFAAAVAEHLGDDLRYTDPLLDDASHPGEITAGVVQRLTGLVREQLTEARMAAWFGDHATARKYPDPLPGLDRASAVATLDAGVPCQPAAASRFAFRRGDPGLVLHADGASHPCPASAEPVLRAWSDQQAVDPALLVGPLRDVALALLEAGSLEPASGSSGSSGSPGNAKRA